MKRLLVANRGEIAAHILRTARGLGLETVCVYSQADAQGPWLDLADQAICVGAAPAADSYLRGDRVLQAAADSGADAIHPGYGFLAENADFAQSVLDAGLIWVGPPPAAMRAMADKAAAKERMAQAGVPLLPGYRGDDQSVGGLSAHAQDIGFPLLVKATAGGGGRGMRVVREPAELSEAITSAAREATAAFGDGRLMLERLIDGGRHVEVQILADTHGHVLHLGERDCSAQRRRQKVIEETPAPSLDPALRARLCAAAVQAAQAVGYVGAGTVEFLVQGGEFWFLEMNTRLQVEFAVTQMCWGQDLVGWQLRIAQGAHLPQTLPAPQGAAIEVRICAEDPCAGLAPQTGVLTQITRPQGGEHLQLHLALEPGSAVSPYYDPMLGKLIAWGPDRDQALARLRRALSELRLLGVQTNRDWLLRLLQTPEFVSGTLHTGHIDHWAQAGHPLFERPTPTERDWALAALALCEPQAAWLRSSGHCAFDLELVCGSTTQTVRVSPGRPFFELAVGETVFHLAMGLPQGRVQVEERDRGRRWIWVHLEDGQCVLDCGSGLLPIREVRPGQAVQADLDASKILSPTAGNLCAISVSVGDAVEPGHTLAKVEAMKLETRVLAQSAGTVRAIHAALGEQVQAGALLIELELSE